MKNIAKKAGHFSAVAALVLSLGLMSLVGCAPQGAGTELGATGAEAAAENGGEGGELAPLTEDIYYQGSAAPVNEPHTEGVPEAAADAEGQAAAAEAAAGADAAGADAAPADVAAILASCTGSCHDAAELEAYTASPEEVQAEMESMAGYVQPALTNEQVAALVDYYTK